MAPATLTRALLLLLLLAGCEDAPDARGSEATAAAIPPASVHARPDPFADGKSLERQLAVWRKQSTRAWVPRCEDTGPGPPAKASCTKARASWQQLQRGELDGVKAERHLDLALEASLTARGAIGQGDAGAHADLARVERDALLRLGGYLTGAPLPKRRVAFERLRRFLELHPKSVLARRLIADAAPLETDPELRRRLFELAPASSPQHPNVIPSTP